MIFWIAALLRAAIVLAPDGAAHQVSEPAVATKGADLDLLGEVRGLALRVEALRGQQFADAPRAVRVPEELLEAAALERAGLGRDARRVEARGRAWAEIGLGDERCERGVREALALDLAGVGLDPREHRVLVGLDRLSAADFLPGAQHGDPATVLMLTGVRPDEPLLAHVLVHLRQQEREGKDPLTEQTTDRMLARRAWQEGEANLVALLHFVSGIGLAPYVGTLDPREVLQGRLAPLRQPTSPAAAALVRFVYDEGYAASVERWQAGAWAALDRATIERQTTRDLMHPDRAPLGSARFDEPATPAGPSLRLVDEDTLGEQGIVVLVATLTGKDSLALQAGDGWAGDRLYRWESEGSSERAAVTEWVTRWVSPEKASDFEYAYGRTLSARFPGIPLEPIAEGQRALTTAARVFRVERRGAEVRVRVSPVGEKPRTP